MASRPGLVSPGTAGRPRVPSVQVRVPWDSCSAPRHLARSRVARDAGRNCGASGTGLSHPKAWSTTRTLLLGAESPGKVVDSTGIRTLAPVTWDSWSIPSAFGPGPQSPSSAGRPRRLLDVSACGPGEQVHTAGPLSRTGVPWDSFMTPWALGSGPESPGTAGRPRLPADQAQVAWERYSTLWHLRHGSESPEMLVATVGPREWA